MKWKGLRQSANIVDMRKVTSAAFIWIDSGNEMWKSSSVPYAVVFPDGNVIISKEISQSNNIRVYLVYESSFIDTIIDSFPSMTQGHRTGLIRLIKHFNNVGKIIQVSSEGSGDVIEFVRSTVRNIKG